MRGRLIDLGFSLDRKQRVTVEIDSDFRETYDTLKSGDITVEIKKWHEKRSLDQNALLWKICQLIGESLNPPIPKEDVYRRAIRDVGVYEPLPIKNSAVDDFVRRWGHQKDKGVGWFAEVIGKSKLDGFTLVHAYYGSSTYDKREMSVLLNYLVDEAKQMEIPMVTTLYDEWEREYGKKDESNGNTA